MGAECGKMIEQGDPEVSEVIDFAHYYAERGRELEHIDGATLRPAALTVVTPPWNFPVAIPAGSVLAGLAAGSPVIIKPASQAARCGAVLVEALWAAGVRATCCNSCNSMSATSVGELISDPRVERVILTGAYETAELFRSFRPDLPLLAETSGKNAIIVTPSADMDLAVQGRRRSAFGHAGQKCSAASLVILVGSVARLGAVPASARRRGELLTVGRPWDPTSQMGPLIKPAGGKLLGRSPRSSRASDGWSSPAAGRAGALWKPGVRDGVAAGLASFT